MNLKQCIVISDSFKGTLSSLDICRIASESTARLLPNCQLTTLPVADGGEGTVDCFLHACGGTRRICTVADPYGQDMETYFAVLPDGTAIIEMASCAGLPLVKEPRNPARMTTFGVGQQIRFAVEDGAKRIILGLGGSATNDGGCGAAAAMGVRFFNRVGETFVPTGETLDQIENIDLTEAQRLLSGVRVTAMCDIDNPMHGPAGAAYVFAPQKGADAEMTAFLDQQLCALDQIIKKRLNLRISELPGSGAAGAFGAGCRAFFNGQLKSGIETVLDLVDFDGKLKTCDLVITGEGQLDSQSIHGKVISGVASRAKAAQVPVVALVGSIADESGAAYELGVSAIFSTNRRAEDFSISRLCAEENYRRCYEDILRLLRIS